MAVEAAVVIDRSRPRFFLVMALVCLAVIAVGFGPSFFLRPFSGATDYATGSRSLPPHLLLHGLALTAWYVLFAVQTALAAMGRITCHQRLGIVGVVVAVAVVATTVVAIPGFPARTIATMTAMGYEAAEVDRVLSQHVVAAVGPGSGGLALFTVYVAAGLYLRRSAATHKRLMLLASLASVGPALSQARLLGQLLAPFPAPVLNLVFLGALVWYDVATLRRVHPATWWGLAGNVAMVAVLTALLSSDAGLVYVRWLASLYGSTP